MTVLIEPEKEKQLDGGFKEKKTERAEKFNKGIEKILITILRWKLTDYLLERTFNIERYQKKAFRTQVEWYAISSSLSLP